MFTVIICSEDFVANTQGSYSHIMEAISKNEDCAVCLWDPKADSFERALPDLPRIIAGKSQWRAVVVQDTVTFGVESADKRNPFDKVGAVRVIQDYNENTIFTKLEELQVLEETLDEVAPEHYTELEELIAQSRELVLSHRKQKKDNYAAAVDNPLTKLGIWLTGITDKLPDMSSQLAPELYNDATEIDKAYYSLLLEQGALVSEMESYHILKYKYDTLFAKFQPGAMVIHKPETILVVSERLKTHADDVFYTHPGEFEEMEYSNFCDDNIYNGRMRFVFFDVSYENGRKDVKDYLSFLTSILAFTEHEIPSESIRAERVYKAKVEMNEKKIVSYYGRYLSKLYRTKRLLMSAFQKRIDDTSKENLPREEALALFESDVTIPVVISKEHNRQDLMGRYSELGLSRDCPKDEYQYWYQQVRNIMKSFMYYIREPRRALKKSVQRDFRDNSTILNDKAMNLSESQVEDIQYRLIEEEQRMVETTTISLFRTKDYTEKLDEADREVRKGISQRMTKKKTVIVSLIAVLAYFIGFLPLMFSNVNTVKSFLFSLGVTGIALAAFMIVGFVFLFVLRKRLVNRIKHFNYVMSGILASIDDGLKSFSRYLSHACNVMREFSVLNWLKKDEDIKLNVLKKHIRDIDFKIKETEEMFAGDYSFKLSVNDEEEPYAYDFSVPRDYEYPIPYYETDAMMLFVSKENWVITSMDYADSITITREELYD